MLLALAQLLLCVTISAQIPTDLKVGMKAPEIKVERWIKGDSISKLQNGMIYVMEFGSVGCSPCRSAIPHLSRLAKKHSENVIIISVFTDHHIKPVQRFVKNLGEAIQYSVAADGMQKAMQNTWLKASGQNSIPVAFVIDVDGTIVWIGHPIELEDVLDEIIDKTFAPILAMQKQQARQNTFERMQRDMKRGNYGGAINCIDSLISVEPDNPYFPVEKFNMMLDSDEKEAYEYAAKLLHNELKDIESSLFYLARAIEEKESQLKAPSWRLVVALTERAFKLSKSEQTSAHILTLQAKAYNKMGNLEKAIQIQRKAISLLAVYSSTEVEEYYKYLNQILAQYQKQ